MRLIDVDVYCATICRCNRRECDKAKCPIHNAPTAYSVDKVIEELEENASRYTKKYVTPYGNNGYRDTKAISIHKAIEIVKQGGVSDDVCEWRLCDEEANVYDTSCRNPHILIEGTPKENNYEYCPYCGKKIKAGGENE